jgi:pyruvate kinase
VGQSIVVGDGSVFFRVVEIVDDSTVQVEAENTGLVIRCAGVTFPDASPKEHLTDETWEMIRLLVPIKPEYLAFSFVESADMMRRIKARVKEIAGDTWSPLIVAKIESKSGVINAKEIAQEADALMVARGDLALAIPIATLPRTQRMLCETARECGIPSIVATNILDSMENSPLPSRADVGDLTGIIRDGADYAMLCRSTAHTENPGAVVKMAKEIILDLSGGDST